MPIEPFRSEILQLTDGTGMYWEACGNPKGKPALYLQVDRVRDCKPVTANFSIRNGVCLFLSINGVADAAGRW